MTMKLLNYYNKFKSYKNWFRSLCSKINYTNLIIKPSNYLTLFKNGNLFYKAILCRIRSIKSGFNNLFNRLGC